MTRWMRSCSRPLMALLSGIVVLPGLSSAQSQGHQAGIVVLVVSTPGDIPIAAHVFMRENGGAASDLGDTVPVGHKTVPPAVTCTDTLQFHAQPDNKGLFTENLNDWEPCARVVRLRVVAGDVTGATSYVLLDGHRGGGVGLLQGKLRSAIAVGDLPDVAAYSNDIAATLRQEGDRGVASRYATMSIVAGEQSLPPSDQANGQRLVGFDRVQGAWAMTPAGKQALVKFQSTAGVKATGQWDWATYNALQAAKPEIGKAFTASPGH